MLLHKSLSSLTKHIFFSFIKYLAKTDDNFTVLPFASDMWAKSSEKSFGEQSASTAFSKELNEVRFNDAIAPVISNSEPTPTTDAVLLKERLKKQMVTGVRWRETMEVMESQGVTTIVEIGPGNVLSGLAKRSLKGVTINQIASAFDLGH